MTCDRIQRRTRTDIAVIKRLEPIYLPLLLERWAIARVPALAFIGPHGKEAEHNFVWSCKTKLLGAIT